MHKDTLDNLRLVSTVYGAPVPSTPADLTHAANRAQTHVDPNWGILSRCFSACIYLDMAPKGKMTRFLLILWMGFMFQAFGQGTILFSNRVGPIDVPIHRGDGTGAGAGVTAQLFLIQRAGGDAFYLPLFPTTTFRTTSPSAAFYLNQVTVTVPGIPAGEFAEVFMRVWNGPSFESAVLVKGESHPLTVGPLGGLPSNGGPPLPDALLIGLVMKVPEPSISALILLGTLILTGRRGKKN